MMMNQSAALNPLDAIRALIDPAIDADFDRYTDLRNLMTNINSTDDDYASDAHYQLRSLIAQLDHDSLSLLALELSLCPLHMIDYAICFDDDDPACAAIRTAFPSHDT